MLVVGDYYMFGEYRDKLFLTRLIRDFEINSKDDLTREMREQPDLFSQYADVSLEYLPTSVAFAMADISPVMATRFLRAPAIRSAILTMKSSTRGRTKSS